MSAPRIQLHHLSYSIFDTAVQFGNVNLSLSQKRYGIVGDNGIGKTTLFKLILGELKPETGFIEVNGSIAYLPQAYHFDPNMTVGELMEEDWRFYQYLALLGESDLDVTTMILDLSGGQKTKLLLIKAILADADFILLDEPTNHLDQDSKNALYEWMDHYQKGLILISHDRELLEHMDEVIEITTKGIAQYGGNYSLYREQKALHIESAQHDLAVAQQKLKAVKRNNQLTREKHEQRQRKGKALRQGGHIDKLTANAMRGRSEKSHSRNTAQADSMTQNAEARLWQAKAKLEIKETLKIDLSATAVPQGKVVLSIEDLTFAYPNQQPLFEHFNLHLTGPERIAIVGKNGSGKTTLLKLVLREIVPQVGEIKLGVDYVCYLEQSVAFLVPDQSILDNLFNSNTQYTPQDAHAALARFGFKNTQALKKVKDLSGGEKIRAGLAVSLMSATPPQLIILDEPTNHLDISSIEAVEYALSQYQGAMLIVSHDQQFLENIGATEIRISS